MKVLVTDGDARAALAVTRSLGRRGHTVVVGEKRSPALAQASRYCARRLVYPDPASREREFVEFLGEVARAERIDAILPVADITTCLVAENRELFEPACRVPLADAATIARAADKAGLVRTADAVGVPTPRTWLVCTAEERPDEDVTYPVVLKPCRSRVRTPGGWLSCSVGYARTPAELLGALRQRLPHEFPLLLQERIVGPGLGVFVCIHNAELVALFGHRRLREKPPWGGVSVLCESTPVCPEAREYTERLMRELGWQGVAMVEFKRDQRDGLPKLMEINGRFWGSLQLAIDAGVDFPNILLDTWCGEVHRRPLPEYRVAVKSRWLWGDFDSLLIRMRSRQDDWPAGDGGGRLAAVAQFLRFAGRDLCYDNPKPYDLAPWLLETRRHLWP